MLLSKEGISGILLYSLYKCTASHTATFTLAAIIPRTGRIRSSYTGIDSPHCLLGCRRLGSFFSHDKLPLFIWTTIALHVLCPTSTNPGVTVALASSGWTHTAAKIPHKILYSESTRSYIHLAHNNHIILNGKLKSSMSLGYVHKSFSFGHQEVVLIIHWVHSGK